MRAPTEQLVFARESGGGSVTTGTLKESSSEERVPAEPGPKQKCAAFLLRRGSPAPRKTDS